MKIKKGDSVKVILGKDKSKVAKVLEVYPKEDKILVEGINQYKRHFKGRVQGQKSEILTLTKPLSVSSVQLVCPKCNKITRIGIRIEKGKKVRFCRRCEKEI